MENSRYRIGFKSAVLFPFGEETGLGSGSTLDSDWYGSDYDVEIATSEFGTVVKVRNKEDKLEVLGVPASNIEYVVASVGAS